MGSHFRVGSIAPLALASALGRSPMSWTRPSLSRLSLWPVGELSGLSSCFSPFLISTEMSVKPLFVVELPDEWKSRSVPVACNRSPFVPPVGSYEICRSSVSSLSSFFLVFRFSARLILPPFDAAM